MLNAITRFSLRQRLFVVAFSVFLIGYGAWTAMNMDIDVFPNLNRMIGGRHEWYGQDDIGKPSLVSRF